MAWADQDDCWFFFCWLSNLFSFNFDIFGFDCAKQFDKIARFYSVFEDIQIQSPTKGVELIDYTNDLGKTFLDNRCAGKVNDWAYKSDFEVVIWHSGIDWNAIAHMEKLYNHDIDCPLNYDPICSLKPQFSN